MKRSAQADETEPRPRKRWRRWGRWLLRGFLAVFAAVLIAAYLTTDGFAAFGGRISGQRKLRVQASPNFSDGSFRNLVPTHTLMPGTLLQTLRGQFFGNELRSPQGKAGVRLVLPRPGELVEPSALPPLQAWWQGL
jgi:hypothetical protein